MSRKGQRLRNTTAIEIDRRIRSAGDHIGGLIGHENALDEAAALNDIDVEAEARRRFDRDLQAFLAAARTARNYLIQKAEEFGREAWLVARLAPPLFQFHGAVANQDLHDHEIASVKTYDVRWSGVTDVVRLVDGGEPRLIPRPSAPPLLTGMRLTYVAAELEPSARAAHAAIKGGPRGERGIVELAGDYIQGLRQIVRDAERDGLFGAPSDVDGCVVCPLPSDRAVP
jgi:hypothetical protein